MKDSTYELNGKKVIILIGAENETFVHAKSLCKALAVDYSKAAEFIPGNEETDGSELIEAKDLVKFLVNVSEFAENTTAKEKLTQLADSIFATANQIYGVSTESTETTHSRAILQNQLRNAEQEYKAEDDKLEALKKQQQSIKGKSNDVPENVIAKNQLKGQIRDQETITSEKETTYKNLKAQLKALGNEANPASNILTNIFGKE